MKINVLEKKIKELKQRNILPAEFKLTVIGYKDKDVKIAAGNIEDSVFKWDEEGKGYISYDTDEVVLLDEENEIQLGKSLKFRPYAVLNC